MNRNEMAIMAAIIRKYGTRVNGGWEVSLPYNIISDIPTTGTITQQPQTPNAPLRLVYSPNITIEGVISIVDKTPIVTPSLPDKS
jgi:hypothetical protein